MAKSSSQLEQKIAQLKAQQSELNKQLRVARKREEAARAAERQAADRREAGAVLAYMRDQGVPSGKGLAFLEKLQLITFDGGTGLYEHVVRRLEDDDRHA